jgi:Phage tail lysozyme
MSSSGEMGSSGENVGRAMTLLDGDWTPQQAQGLLDSLKLNCGMPDWKPEALKRLRDWCTSHQEDATTVEGQLEFIAHELLHSFKAVGILLQRAETVEEARQAVQPYVRRLVSGH